MRITLIAVSRRQPAWVSEGYRHYAKRFRGRCRLELEELPPGRRRGAGAARRAVEEEGERMLAAVPSGARVVALSGDGALWTTPELAARLEAWMMLGARVCVLIGGPDGLAGRCLERADERWSLSRLTLPHGLVRVVAAEALYRASSLLEGHPYHRA